jgi:uncharacterized protein YigA (DUF484 family)
MTTEEFTVWHDVLVATEDDWIAEKCRILLILEKAKANLRIQKKAWILAELQKKLLKLDDVNDDSQTVEEFMDKLAFCYPKLRIEKQDEFIPAGPDAALHINPKRETNLAQLHCPFCKTALGAILVNKEFDIKAVGCAQCNRGFTPNELIQIRQLQKKTK